MSWSKCKYSNIADVSNPNSYRWHIDNDMDNSETIAYVSSQALFPQDIREQWNRLEQLNGRRVSRSIHIHIQESRKWIYWNFLSLKGEMHQQRLR